MNSSSIEEFIFNKGILLGLGLFTISFAINSLLRPYKDNNFKDKNREIVSKFMKTFDLMVIPKASNKFLEKIISSNYRICDCVQLCSVDDVNWKRHQVYDTPIVDPDKFIKLTENAWKNIFNKHIYEENLDDIYYKVYKIDKHNGKYNLEIFTCIAWNGVHN